MENYKDEIIRQVIQINYGPIFNGHDMARKIDEAIQWAWDNWDNDTLADYYDYEKPQHPTEKFIIQWVENEDFEADGYDIDYLKKIFE